MSIITKLVEDRSISKLVGSMSIITKFVGEMYYQACRRSVLLPSL